MVARRRVVVLAALAALLAGCDTHKPFSPGASLAPHPQSWIQTAGPSTENVKAVVDYGGELFVGSQTGVWRSPDGGAFWQGRWHETTEALVASAGTLVVGTWWGVRYTPADGAVWGYGSAPGFQVYALANHRAGALFAGIQEFGTYRSTDLGRTWTQRNGGMRAGEISTAFLSLFADELYAGTSQGAVYRTINDGLPWTRVDTGLPGAWIATLHVAPGKIFAGTRGAGLWVSTDRAATWRAVAGGLPADADVLALRAYGVNPIHYAATSVGLYRTIDGGDTWQIVLTCVPGTTSFTSLAEVGGVLYAGTTTRGVIASANGWDWTLRGPPVSSPHAVAEAGSTLLSGASGIYRSLDRGVSWELTNVTIGSAQCFVKHGSSWFAGVGSAILRSLDDGVTWTLTSSPGPGVQQLASNGAVVVGSAGGRVVRSRDDGASWQSSTSPSLHSLAARGEWVIGATALTSSPAVYRSTDGSSWQPATTGLPERDHVTCLFASDRAVYAGLAQHGLYVSYDEGEHWSATLLGNVAVDRVVAHGPQIFVQTTRLTEKQLHYSADYGRTWVRAEPGIEQVGILALAAGTHAFYAGVRNAAVWTLPY